ncbi:hypothetical protein FB192DRAFT_1362274 [Mucor lusitanicus]|uniref:Uncharacterized protein n=2 Tax=Mucor circinelloides f. lusitanicus TaxID=29924 RepID=A0A162MS55_MUCCL|nr:hypothetical protein FB192DRAFT_1362274 [Mucor lusitanicus]OAD04785.1 hypothetical protein MUCCIDRAFT_155717 [Mucor lusitanicus CBS 277.49]
MASYQFGNTSQFNQPMRTCNSSNKRRMDDEDEEPIVTKRYFDLHTQFSPDQPPQKELPAITYASPDYRPPPPAELPLWLQPMSANSPMTEDDSEDDSALLTPSYQLAQQQQQQQQQQQFGKPANEYWGAMMIDQWQ